MNNPLERLVELARASASGEADLRRAVRELSQFFAMAIPFDDVMGASDIVDLDKHGFDDFTYGKLVFGQGRLRIAYRTTLDDIDDMHETDERAGSFSLAETDSCAATWLRALMKQNVVESLVNDLTHRVETRTKADAAARDLVARAMHPASDVVESSVIEAARQAGYIRIADEWLSARAALGTDVADAITRASSLIESVCQHVLAVKGLAPPTKQTAQPLSKAAFAALGLVGTATGGGDSYRTLTGLASIVDGVGALRTHAGTAHGRAPAHQQAGVEEARLAVNAAGLLATYIMELANAQPPAPDVSDAAPPSNSS